MLFTSFERYKPLSQVLNTIGEAFSKIQEQQGIFWLTLDDDQRKNIAVQILKQYQILWIWDNVETIAGFPIGDNSLWSQDEQNELADFLRIGRTTNAKFLLTSRRDEQIWLGDLPIRIGIPAMPMLERLELTRALAKKRNHRMTDIEDWEPLLKFTLGNPLTITVLVGQALRDRLKYRWQIEAFVEQLQKGEAIFNDEVSQGRSRSLGASLNYGFKHSFSENELKILALLHFFQGFVFGMALDIMVNDDAEWALTELKGLTKDKIIAILDLVAEMGLLTAHGNGYYSIHPALPWYFKSIFEQYYINNEVAMHAFVEAMGALGIYYHNQCTQGNLNVIDILRAEEGNLLFARSLAKKFGWWHAIVANMEGLNILYDYREQTKIWKQLVDDITPYFLDFITGAALTGRDEEDWDHVVSYRIHLEMQTTRRWEEVERLQSKRIDRMREVTRSFLTLPVENLDYTQRVAIRNLAAVLQQQGEIQREAKDIKCLESYLEALRLFEKVDDNSGAAASATGLGNFYKSLRDFDNMQYWHERALRLRW